MNTVAVYLIITMGSIYGISYQGFGGVSVTKMDSMEECLYVKSLVEQQVEETDHIEMDDKEVIVSCRRSL